MIRRLSTLPHRRKKNRKTVTFFPQPGRGSLHEDPEAFMRAAISNDVNTMRTMMAAGFDPNCCLDTDPVLLLCAKMGYLDAVRIILHAGPCDDILDSNGLTALHYASIHGHAEIVALLLQAGAYIDTRVHTEGEYYYMTPLILACTRNRHATAAILLDRRASVKATDCLGRTALHHACSRSDTTVLVYQLLAAGADAEVCDASGTTPLMYAAMALNLRVVKALLVWGVDIDICSRAEGNIDAVYWTKRGKRASIVTVLKPGAGKPDTGCYDNAVRQ